MKLTSERKKNLVEVGSLCSGDPCRLQNGDLCILTTLKCNEGLVILINLEFGLRRELEMDELVEVVDVTLTIH